MAVCSVCGRQNPELARFWPGLRGAARGADSIGRDVRKAITVVLSDVAGSIRAVVCWSENASGTVRK
jgi:hypothetical protein